MDNEYYGAASTPTSDFLAHYGVKGMKWGVRKAVASGNARKLSKAYNKAAKKLQKLEKRGSSGKKYAKRAAKLGVGAALASMTSITGGWGNKNTVGKAAQRGANAVLQAAPDKVTRALNAALKNGGHAGLGSQINKLASISNTGYTKLAGTAIGAGLGAGAAYNAYRAATAKHNAKKAAQFKSEMNKAFAGTKYANDNQVSGGKSENKSNNKSVSNSGSKSNGKKRRKSNRG